MEAVEDSEGSGAPDPPHLIAMPQTDASGAEDTVIYMSGDGAPLHMSCVRLGAPRGCALLPAVRNLPHEHTSNHAGNCPRDEVEGLTPTLGLGSRGTFGRPYRSSGRVSGQYGWAHSEALRGWLFRGHRSGAVRRSAPTDHRHNPGEYHFQEFRLGPLAEFVLEWVGREVTVVGTFAKTGVGLLGPT